jgi:pSer/pThr/pTyr-binding forkhead associated (FHA) protein
MTHNDTTDHDPFVKQDALVIRMRVALKGRPVRTHSFNKGVITLGRDPQADVFLDNPGISREHARIDKTDDGYVVEDLGSANGTYLNDEQIQRKLLANDDVLRIGKFSLWVSLEEDRRKVILDPPSSSTTFQGTTVLSTGDLEKMMTKVRNYEQEAPPAPEPPPTREPRSRPPLALVVAVAFTGGVAFGLGVIWLLLR